MSKTIVMNVKDEFKKAFDRYSEEWLEENKDLIEEYFKKIMKDVTNQDNPKDDGWISVKNRMPTSIRHNGLISEKVLIAYGVQDKQIQFGWYKGYKDKEWVTSDMKPFARQELITHWMPLPESPETATTTVKAGEVYISYGGAKSTNRYNEEIEKRAKKILKKTKDKAVKNEMPELKCGMLIEPPHGNELFIITNAEWNDDAILCRNVYSVSSTPIRITDIVSIYEYHNCDTGIDMSGKDTESKLWTPR